MNFLLRHIEFLLSSHDCVIVPTLGAITATWQNASLQSETGVFSQPRRTYSFNSKLKESDGLLIMSVAKSNATDYDTASKMVLNAVNNLKKDLGSHGEYNLGNIGRLEMSMLGEIHLIPFANDRITPLSGWIGAIKTNELALSAKETKKLDETTIAALKPSRFTRFIRTTVGAVAAIILAIVLSTPISVKYALTASTVPPVKSPKSVQLNNNETIKTVETTIVNEIIEPKVEITETEEKISTTAEVRDIENNQSDNSYDSKSIRFNFDDPYVLVVASLAKRHDAEQFIRDYSNLFKSELGIIDCGNKFRIYAATGRNIKEAQNFAVHSDISNLFKSSWVTHR